MAYTNLFEKYYDKVDSMIDTDFGITATVYHTGAPVPCSACSSSIYGGPDINNLNCMYCGGTQFVQRETTSSVKLRVYYNKRDFLKVGSVESADGDVQIIGHMRDIDTVRSGEYIILDSTHNLRYKLKGELNPWGFKRNTYFVGYLQRC